MIWLLMSAWTAGSCVLAWLMWKSLPGADGQTLAAWFQAVGSIAAIFVAFLVGREQSKAALRAVTEERHERRSSIVAVAAAAAEHARRIADALDHDGIGHAAIYNVYDKSIVDGMVSALSSAPAHEVGSPDGVIALLALRDQFVFLGVQMAKYLAGPRRDPEFTREIESCGDNLEYQHTVLKGQEQVLAHNVRTHLNEIRRRHEELAAAVARLRTR